MYRIVSVFIAFGLVAIAFYADSIEMRFPVLGMLLWGVFFIGSVALLYWQAIKTGRSPVVCAIALIPLLNLLLIPVTSIVLAALPTKKSKAAK